MKLDHRLQKNGIEYFDKWEVMTLSQYYNTYPGSGMEGELSWVRCLVCDGPFIRSKTAGQERLFRFIETRSLFATCSDECFNMYILQHI